MDTYVINNKNRYNVYAGGHELARNGACKSYDGPQLTNVTLQDAITYITSCCVTHTANVCNFVLELIIKEKDEVAQL